MSASAKLTRKMHAAVAALLTCATEGEAAEQVGIGHATLRRWKARPEFRTELQRASRDLLNDTLARMRVASRRALDALTAALDEPHPPTRVRAALGILDLAVKVDLDDLARRVEALEQLQPDTKGET